MNDEAKDTQARGKPTRSPSVAVGAARAKSDGEAATTKKRGRGKAPSARAREGEARAFRCRAGHDRRATADRDEAEERGEARPVKAPAPARRGDTPAPATPALVRAQARYVRTSARKARLVCDHIRGKSVDEARAILQFAPRAVARDWSKLLESAVANAEHNHELLGDELRITDVHADEGPTLKRYRPRAMGRATRIRKRTSHLSITLTPKETL